MRRYLVLIAASCAVLACGKPTDNAAIADVALVDDGFNDTVAVDTVVDAARDAAFTAELPCGVGPCTPNATCTRTNSYACCTCPASCICGTDGKWGCPEDCLCDMSKCADSMSQQQPD